jgi:hypothetical protein
MDITTPSDDSAVPGGIAAAVDPHNVALDESSLIVAESVERADDAGTLTLGSILAADKKRALLLFDDGDLKAVEDRLS